MFGVSSGELITILIVAIVFLNPKDWPRIVRIIGKWYGKWLSFYHAIMNDFQDAMDAEELNLTKADKDTCPKESIPRK